MTVAYTDGARRSGDKCACAFAVFDGDHLTHSAARFIENARTNNQAEFHGLIDCLMWAEKNKIMNLVINCDSMLVINTTLGIWKIKHEELRPLRDLAYALLTRGEHVLSWVRGHSGNRGNELVDELCNQALDQEETKLNRDLLLVHDTASAYFERTGEDFWALDPVSQRKELEAEDEARLSQ
jgi:ribonuclease HI